MAVHRLHNEDWGIETNCFVCEPSNGAGLRIPFFHDDERGLVTAEFELSMAFSGAPTLVHGGVTLAITDEAMAWACIAIGRCWAVTTETTSRFHGTVRVGSRYRVEAGLDGADDTVVQAVARVVDDRGRVRVESAATFTVLGEAQVRRIAGSTVALAASPGAPRPTG